jgi:hypothetical protein
VNGRDNAAGFGIELVLCLGISYTCHCLTGSFLDINISSGADFSCYHDQSCSYQCFAGHFGVGVLSEKFIEYGVADLVGYFVGMAFRD